ncbi:hypothetical protein [Sulfobacillus harzensis]|uniref:TrmB family transcriptional regulator n=1 Tax=Sulfobacillus harzensis TaxID=2729629 RepID=A0A7Y0Q4Y0_9FIRM|nr:hypothetical protein [Sulfobacillus harzensis]NMP24496.1 TrmB family transcriptional regulator [Sulfobacillus harzensis]
MATDFEMPTLRAMWRRWRQPRGSPPPMRRRNLPVVPMAHREQSHAVSRAVRSEPATWPDVLRTVRQWPSGMPVTSDLIAQVFGVGRGQAWRWLERLERAGLVAVTEDPPNAKGVRRKRRWVR